MKKKLTIPDIEIKELPSQSGSQALETSHNIKIGTFQLQTKSFWITLVSLLTLFMFAICFMNAKLCFTLSKEVMQHNERLVKMLIEKSPANEAN